MLRKLLRTVDKIIKLPFKSIVYVYRYLISPLLGPRCRFYPSCSEYALEAFQKYPLPKALLLVCRRLLNCQPFGRSGFDPVPDKPHNEKK